LEKELGLSLNEANKVDSNSHVAGIVVEHSRTGCIPDNWIYSLFGAALPVEQNCWIWDWLLSKKEKFAGTRAHRNIIFTFFEVWTQEYSSLQFFWVYVAMSSLR
jgi:hypothetical protein